MSKKSLAIIPARGGSKRIPRKNIKDFLGKPVIAYSIQAALDSGLFEEVMVSTEDEEIARIAQSYGARVPFMRSDKTADDHAGTAEVLLEVLDEYEKQNRVFDFGCCIYPVAPLISVKSVTEAFSLMELQKYDNALPICRFSNSIWRALELDSSRHVKMIWPDNETRRTQDLPESFFDAGQFYWFRVEKFRETGKILTGSTGAVVLDELCVQDIDSPTDWQIAEMKYRILNQQP